MAHLWIRAEGRPNERRTGVTPAGVQALIKNGWSVTVEQSETRIIPISDYAQTGCAIATEGAWVQAPKEAIIMGLKELPDDDRPLIHRHIMFGHAFKGQHSGQRLLARFKAGGGTLFDLEYLTQADGRRVAAFGYWAGYVGAAVSLQSWAAQKMGGICGTVESYETQQDLLSQLAATLEATGQPRPNAIIIGAKGRVGTGAADLCTAAGLTPTLWDIKETASGGPFPEILAHDIFLNCILARPGTPVFVPKSAQTAPRSLSVIGDIACDPDSDYNPVPIYSNPTDWTKPALRVHDEPPLDVMAIDNLPSLLPLESSQDFAEQLLPHLLKFDTDEDHIWARAEHTFTTHLSGVYIKKTSA